MTSTDSRGEGLPVMGGPADFTPVEGRSFPRAMQVVATLVMLGLLASGWQLRHTLAAMSPPSELVLLAGLVAVVVAWSYLNILLSTTRISNDAISQGWLWRHSVPLRNIAQVKLLRFKPLDFLVAPRLVVRAGALGNSTFYVADPAVLTVVDLLVHGHAEQAR